MPIVTTSQPTTTPTQGTGNGSIAAEDNVYMFVVGWILLIMVLTLINKSRLGHVIIYYSLLMMILVILLAEYQQYLPFFNAIQTIQSFNSGSTQTQGAA